MQSCTHVETSTGTTANNSSNNNNNNNNNNKNNNNNNNNKNNNNNNNNNGLYFTRDKDTYPMFQLFINTVKHNKMNKLIIES